MVLIRDNFVCANARRFSVDRMKATVSVYTFRVAPNVSDYFALEPLGHGFSMLGFEVSVKAHPRAPGYGAYPFSLPQKF